MTLDTLIMLTGGIMLLMPFGAPPSWYMPLFFIFGILVICLGIVVRRGGSKIFKSTKQTRGFVESSPMTERSVEIEGN